MKKWIFQSVLCLVSGFVFGQGNLRLGLPLGHNSRVNTISFSHDGKLYATTSEDKTAIIWDAATNRLLHCLAGHSGEVTDAVFSKDDKELVTTSWDNTVRIWDVQSGSLLKVMNGHLDIVETVRFSPDGSILVTTSRDGTAKVWNARTKTYLYDLAGDPYPEDYITKIQFRPDGKSIIGTSINGNSIMWTTSIKEKNNYQEFFDCSISYSPDGKYYIWGRDDGIIVVGDALNLKAYYNILKSNGGHTDSIKIISISSDSRYFLSYSADKTIKVWELTTGKLVHNLKTTSNKVLRVEFSPCNKYIISESFNRVDIWDAKSGNKLYNSGIASFFIKLLGFSPDGTKFYTSDHWGEIYIWLSTESFPLKTSNIQMNAFTEIAYDHKNMSMLITSGKNRGFVLWDIGSAKPKYFINHGNNIANFARISNCGEYIVTRSYDKFLKVWELHTGKLLHSFTCRSIPDYVEISPDSKYILSCYFKDNKVEIWHIKNRKLHANIVLEGSSGFISAAFSRNSDYILTIARKDNSAKIWKTDGGGLVHNLQGHTKNVTIAIFNSHSTEVLTTALDRTIKIWDVSSGKLKNDIPIPSGHGFVEDIKYSIDGNFIVAGTSKGTILIIDNSVKKILKILSAHDEEISSINISPNSQYISSVSAYENIAKIWDLRSGKLLYNLSGHLKKINSTVFSPNNLFIYTASDDGTFGCYSVISGDFLYKCAFLGEEDYVVALKNNYYMSSRSSSKFLYYISGLQPIGFDQLDLKYNRPDIVMAELGRLYGNTDTMLVNSYYKAWEKRIQKLNISENLFKGDFNMPECDINNRTHITYEQNDKYLRLQIWGQDKLHNLARFNVWVNEVPVFGKLGIDIRSRRLNKFDTIISIMLSDGENKIETSVLNVNGIESYRIPLYVNYTPLNPVDVKLYFVGIGIDRFQEPGHDLKWCVKDIRDQVAAYKKKHPNMVVVDTLFNERVTKENIHALKTKLMQSNVNDKVIIAYSGHGLLSREYDYYLSTHTVKFSQPEINGLPYEKLEWLLDSIPARKKLLLLDACHSGEVDKEEMQAIRRFNDSMATRPPVNSPALASVKGLESIVFEHRPVIGFKSSFELMQDLFSNASRGTGATVISASGGTQFAYEKGELSNGVFTYSILELMQQEIEITVSELKERVGKRVVELTNGLQKPTTRNETIEFDWRVW